MLILLEYAELQYKELDATRGFSFSLTENEDFLVGLVKRKQLIPSFCNDWLKSVLHPDCQLESPGGFKNTKFRDHLNKGSQVWGTRTGRFLKLYT